MGKMTGKMTFLKVCMVAVLALTIAGCDHNTSQPITERRQRDGGDGQTAATGDVHTRLLALAFDTASAIPDNPHIKPKSRAQENVFAACLRLDKPAMALDYADRIGNWRRGSCYADYALYCIRENRPGQIEAYLNQALEISESATQAWRRDRIRTRVAQAYLLLGAEDKAAELQKTVVESETGKTAGMGDALDEDERFEELVASLDDRVATGNFDLMNNAMYGYIRLIDRFYDNEKRHKLLEGKWRAALDEMPPLIKVRHLQRLTETAIGHEDMDKAAAMVDEARAVVDRTRWAVRHEIPLLAGLAELRYGIGQTEQARDSADAALELYRTKRHKVQSFDRAETLRPVAEAYVTMGAMDQALETYKQAIDEGAVNANAKPRAVDLAATLASMAVCGVEPDAALWARVREIRAGLGDPW